MNEQVLTKQAATRPMDQVEEIPSTCSNLGQALTPVLVCLMNQVFEEEKN